MTEDLSSHSRYIETRGLKGSYLEVLKYRIEAEGNGCLGSFRRIRIFVAAFFEYYLRSRVTGLGPSLSSEHD